MNIRPLGDKVVVKALTQDERTLMETPTVAAEEIVPARDAARAAIERALREGRAILTEPESKTVLAAYGGVFVAGSLDQQQAAADGSAPAPTSVPQQVLPSGCSAENVALSASTV